MQSTGNLTASISLLPMQSVSRYSVLCARAFHRTAGVSTMIETNKMLQNYNDTRKIGSSIQKTSDFFS